MTFFLEAGATVVGGYVIKKMRDNANEEKEAEELVDDIADVLGDEQEEGKIAQRRKQEQEKKKQTETQNTTSAMMWLASEGEEEEEDEDKGEGKDTTGNWSVINPFTWWNGSEEEVEGKPENTNSTEATIEINNSNQDNVKTANCTIKKSYSLQQIGDDGFEDEMDEILGLDSSDEEDDERQQLDDARRRKGNQEINH
eukprot:TRINITY_DN5602_c0_g1_i1.p1 TRINITY_DN5602_c0_g1~~TRINITY_DN5602_c0_g1_i1.p1  ORF type:complete len:225 (+),score=92.25 TRINITY_DN5602_c0_g1_i1:83-676(+)